MIKLLSDTSSDAIQAAPLPIGDYTFFKLKGPLKINRRGKDVDFRRGDTLGWRYSSNGRNFRLIALDTGPNVVYSIKITEDTLQWLMRQDPKAKKPHAAPKTSPEAKELPTKGKVTREQFEKQFVPELKKHAAQVLRNIIKEAKAKGADQMKWKVVNRTPRQLDGYHNLVFVAFTLSFPHVVINDASSDLRDRLEKVLNKPRKLKAPLSISGVPVRTVVGDSVFKTKNVYEFAYFVPARK